MEIIQSVIIQLLHIGIRTYSIKINILYALPNFVYNNDLFITSFRCYKNDVLIFKDLEIFTILLPNLPILHLRLRNTFKFGAKIYI